MRPANNGGWYRRSPGSRARDVCTCQVLWRRGEGTTPAFTRNPLLPSVKLRTSTPQIIPFRRSMAGLYTPLSTLRAWPYGLTRMTRGQCGSLVLPLQGLSPFTSCRSPGAPTFG